MHEFRHKSKSPHYPIDHRQWENDIHSFRIFLQRLFKSTTTQRPPGLQQLTLCRSLHAGALQATVSEGLAQGPWRGGYRAGFELTTFRSNDIDSTNVPPRPTNISR